MSLWRRCAMPLAALVAAVWLQGCVVVGGGYSSTHGFFLWPGTFTVVIVLLIVYFLVSRRR